MDGEAWWITVHRISKESDTTEATYHTPVEKSGRQTTHWAIKTAPANVGEVKTT